jgi:DnaJ-class molecular chaperone
MITSETFYRAECDTNGCDRVFPDEDYDGSHFPMEALVELMAVERGEFDERWATTEDGHTYCPRHQPGNIDCTTCGGQGSTPPPDGGDPLNGWWHQCARCDGRGYLVPTEKGENV